jgi:hypothetical protein
LGVVYITHDLATAYYVCNRIAIMFRGNIVAMGDVEQVLMEPKHPYVQLLRDSIPETDPKKRWKTKIQLSESDTEEYLRIGCKLGRWAMDVIESAPEDICMTSALVKCLWRTPSSGSPSSCVQHVGRKDSRQEHGRKAQWQADPQWRARTTALRCGETDHVSWAPLVDPTHRLAARAMSRCAGGAGRPRGCGRRARWISLPVRLVVATSGRHSPIREVEDGVITRRFVTRDTEQLEIVETPVGSLTTERRYSPEGHTTYISVHPISSVADLKVLQYIMEHTHYEEDFDSFLGRLSIIGDDGIPTSDGPQSPIQHFYMFLCGVQATTYMLLDHPSRCRVSR